MSVGFLHPGAMGASIAAAAVAGGTACWWVAEGRSAATGRRAAEAGLGECATLAELVDRCDVVVSVCPPGSAIDVADDVARAGFDGLFVDVNAVAPTTARSIASRFDRFVDGGIIGPPVRSAGTTRLYLSGGDADAEAVAALWEGTDLEVRHVDGGPGAASAVKACFATWTKASSAMLLAVRALARSEGVEHAILGEWATSMPDLDVRAQLTAAGTAPKAWRFVGEMVEQAAADEAAGLPAGFSEAAAEVYARMAHLNDADDPDLDAVLAALLDDAEPG